MADTDGQPPDAAIVLVTVYVAGAVLPERFTKPVAALIDNPTEDVKVPATPPPLNVGDGLVLAWQ